MKTADQLKNMDDHELIHEILVLQEKLRNVNPEESEASAIHNYHFASNELLRLNKDRYLGSAVILTVHSLKGEVLVKPISITDGFSNNTINCLLDDLQYTFNYKTELKPTEKRL